MRRKISKTPNDLKTFCLSHSCIYLFYLFILFSLTFLFSVHKKKIQDFTVCPFVCCHALYFCSIVLCACILSLCKWCFGLDLHLFLTFFTRSFLEDAPLPATYQLASVPANAVFYCMELFPLLYLPTVAMMDTQVASRSLEYFDIMDLCEKFIQMLSFSSLNWGEMIFYCCFNLYSLMIEFEHHTTTSTTVFWVSFCINHLIHISVHFSAGIAFFFFFFTNVPCVCISPWSAWSTSFFSQSAAEFTHSILCGPKRIHV